MQRNNLLTRSEQRMPVGIRASFRVAQNRIPVRIVDLSNAGFRIVFASGWPIGTRGLLRIPSIEPLAGVVIWSEDSVVGCRFERSLHPAVTTLIARRHPRLTICEDGSPYPER